jgi:hypothetical protein
MSNEERAAIVNLMREHVRAVADITTLQAILDLEQRQRRVVDNWQRDFVDMRLSPDYAACIAASEPGIAEIDAVLAEDVRREDDDLIGLIEGLPHHQA